MASVSEALGESESGLREVWLWIKEVGGWAAQHPALLGLSFIIGSTLVKSTKTSVKVLRPGIKLVNPPPDLNPDNPRFADWFVTQVNNGLDIPVWVVKMSAIKKAEKSAAELGSTLAVSGALSGLLNWLIPTIGTVPIAVIPAALLEPDLRQKYPSQTVWEISFRTSLIGGWLWPEDPSQSTQPTTTMSVTNAMDDDVVLLRLSDILTLAGLFLLFGGAVSAVQSLIPKL